VAAAASQPEIAEYRHQLLRSQPVLANLTVRGEADYGLLLGHAIDDHVQKAAHGEAEKAPEEYNHLLTSLETFRVRPRFTIREAAGILPYSVAKVAPGRGLSLVGWAIFDRSETSCCFS
jgi:hypothetical protein